MFNSRQYQDQRENLYLAALPVDAGAVLVHGVSSSPAARRSAATPAARPRADQREQLGPQQRRRRQQGPADRGPAAAQLLQPDRLQLPQPEERPPASARWISAPSSRLLQGGGKAVALESLTLAERNLLYADPQLRPLPQGAVRPDRQQQRRRHQRRGLPAVGRAVQQRRRQVGGLGASGLIPGVIPAVDDHSNGVTVPPASSGDALHDARHHADAVGLPQHDAAEDHRLHRPGKHRRAQRHPPALPGLAGGRPRPAAAGAERRAATADRPFHPPGRPAELSCSRSMPSSSRSACRWP